MLKALKYADKQQHLKEKRLQRFLWFIFLIFQSSVWHSFLTWHNWMKEKSKKDYFPICVSSKTRCTSKWINEWPFNKLWDAKKMSLKIFFNRQNQKCCTNTSRTNTRSECFSYWLVWFKKLHKWNKLWTDC